MSSCALLAPYQFVCTWFLLYWMVRCGLIKSSSLVLAKRNKSLYIPRFLYNVNPEFRDLKGQETHQLSEYFRWRMFCLVVLNCYSVWRLLFFTMTNLHVHMLLYTLQKHKNIFKPVTFVSIWKISRFSNFFSGLHWFIWENVFLSFIPCLREPVIKFTQIWLMKQEKKQRRGNFL